MGEGEGIKDDGFKVSSTRVDILIFIYICIFSCVQAKLIKFLRLIY